MKISTVCYVCFVASLINAMAQQSTPVVTTTAMPTPISSPATSPIASQHQGRPVVSDGTPMPSATAGVTTTSTPAGTRSRPSLKRGQFESMAKKFNPHKVQPMPSTSPSSASTSVSSPAGTLSKQERGESKHERKGGSESAAPSPSATP